MDRFRDLSIKIINNKKNDSVYIFDYKDKWIYNEILFINSSELN